MEAGYCGFAFTISLSVCHKAIDLETSAAAYVLQGSNAVATVAIPSPDISQRVAKCMGGGGACGTGG